MRIGLVSISQTPNNVVPWLRKMIGKDIEFVEAGALDNLTMEEIGGLTPKDDHDLLIATTREGREIKFGKSHILPRLQKCIYQLNKDNVEAITILCTGGFPEFESRAPILRPDLLTLGFLRSMPNLNRVGLLVPDEKQMEPIERDFENLGFKVVTSCLSPNRQGAVEEAVKPFKREDVTVISLNCMGYNPELKEKVVKLTSKPAVLSMSLLAKAIDELLV